MIDSALRSEEVTPYRARVCEGLRGTVVELGFGSGLNIGQYPAAVERVLAIEPSDLAWELAADRRAASRIPIERRGLDGQRLDLEDGSADAVLSTFTLCTIPDPSAALAEVRRVLKPGGTFHFLEHGHSPDSRVAAWQAFFGPLNTRCAGGCHLDRRIDRLIADAGLRLDQCDVGYLRLRAPKSQRYGFAGFATKPG